MDVCHIGDIASGLFDRSAEVNSEDFSGISGNLPGMAPHPAASVKYRLTTEAGEIDPGEVVVEVCFARRLPVIEVRPLVTKAGLGASGGVVLWIVDEPGNAGNNGYLPVTLDAG